MILPHAVQNIINMIGFQVTQSSHAVAIARDLADRMNPEHIAETIKYLEAKLRPGSEADANADANAVK
jgi:hypothetical protein